MRCLSRLFAVIILCAMLMISGCEPKIWLFDFTSAADISEWLAEGIYELNEEGVDGLLLYNESFVVAPVVFSGNFNMSVVFTAMGTPGSSCYLEAGFGGEEDADHQIAVYFNDIKDTGTAFSFGAYEIDWGEAATYEYLFQDEDVTNLDSGGQIENTLLIEKTGKHFKVSLNSSLLFEFDQGDEYDSTYYCPWLYCDDFNIPFDWVMFKSVAVQYWGSMIDR